MVVLGLMSGTSLDGLDLALVRFFDGGKKYELFSALTINYSQDWSSRLKESRQLSKNDPHMTKMPSTNSNDFPLIFYAFVLIFHPYIKRSHTQ